MTCQDSHSQKLKNKSYLHDEFEELCNYLPHLYKDPNEEEYIDHLRNSFYDNYSHERYQFAVLACHMLYMSSAYFSIWQIKKYPGNSFTKNMAYFNNSYISKFRKYKSPFEFSKMKEVKVLKLFKLVDCVDSDVAGFTKLVEARNIIAHPDGNIHYRSEKTTNNQIGKILEELESIQKFMNPLIEKIFKIFLLENCDVETRGHSLKEDAVKETLVHENYLSPKDIKVCLGYDIKQHESDKNYDEMFELFKYLKQEYAYLIQIIK